MPGYFSETFQKSKLKKKMQKNKNKNSRNNADLYTNSCFCDAWVGSFNLLLLFFKIIIVLHLFSQMLEGAVAQIYGYVGGKRESLATIEENRT